MEKNLIKYGVIGAAAVIIAILFLRSCSLYDQNSVLKGQYRELKKITDADHVLLTAKIASQYKIIRDKTKEIADLLANAGKPTEAEKEKDVVIVAKEKEIARLKALGDYKAALEQSQAENKAWSEKFTLAEERHKKGLFDLNAKWTAKFDAQVVISNDWKNDRDNENRLRLLAEKRIGKLESSLRWSKFWKTGTTALAIVGGGYVAYDLIRGK